ncbi:MAG: radical SAM protein, partial [Selenomonadaceae bacterium]|nr:radical SAM protein [Selenomonadaceae bacterium]
NDMDNAASISRRIAAMKYLHECGIVTTCFISPIFPGITDAKAIIAATKDYCNLIWLENLNLRGNCKPTIISYVREKYPHLLSLYEDIYNKNDRSYWRDLSCELEAYAKEISLDYVVNDDNMKKTSDSPPTIVNFFYHEQIKKSALKS